MVHRDLKPHNVLLGAGDTIKIGDFGVSRQLSSSLEMAQTVVGSPGYLSPELCNGEPCQGGGGLAGENLDQIPSVGDPYNEKADIWSLGVTLAELCALRHPFGDATSHAALIMRIMRADAPELPLQYSPQLSRLLICCMQRHPAQRPSALQLLSLSTVQQHAVHHGLLANLPPAAVRTGLVSATAAATSRCFDAEQEAPMPAARRDNGSRPVPRAALTGNWAAPRHGAPSRRAAAQDAAMASSGSGPWELKPVCAGRQRRMGTAMSTADAFDGDREDEPSLLPPQVMPVYRRPGGSNVTGEHLQRAYEAAQREDDRQAEGELGYGAVLRTPPPRNVSLWAKRRGAAPPPEALADDLEQQMVIEDGGWRTSQAAESPLDIFARRHCPGPSGSEPLRRPADELPPDSLLQHTSPLSKFVHEQFVPRRPRRRKTYDNVLQGAAPEALAPQHLTSCDDLHPELLRPVRVAR